MNIDILSDIHISHWINDLLPGRAQLKLFETLINKIIPENPSNIIIISGDIGHFNKQDESFFRILRNYYNKIIWVHGNHDLYLTTDDNLKRYNYDSFDRLNEKIELFSKIPDVYYLNGDIIEIENIKFGGCSMWYNNDYAKQVWNKDDVECFFLWKNYLNDSNYIFNNKDQLNYLNYFETQYKLLKKIYLKSDVIITHVSPTWENIPVKYKSVESTFFYFDGSKLLNKPNNKTWIFGHTHDKHHFVHSSGCIMVCNPLDYGFKNWQNIELIRKIITIKV